MSSREEFFTSAWKQESPDRAQTPDRSSYDLWYVLAASFNFRFRLHKRHNEIQWPSLYSMMKSCMASYVATMVQLAGCTFSRHDADACGCYTLDHRAAAKIACCQRVYNLQIADSWQSAETLMGSLFPIPS